MSWIKLEKSLESDPRILRMAAQWEARNAEALQCFKTCNAHALQPVTLVIGAIARLWMLADSHANEHDEMSMSRDEIAAWIGVPGLVELIPECWLVQVDENTVKLPNFQQHNGSTAKRLAQGSRRVANHRKRTKRTSVTSCNDDALPDQTRPDQTIRMDTPSFDPSSVDGLDMDSFMKWRDYRRSLKKPLRGASVAAAARKLAEFGPRQAAVVEQSIAQGWQGLFEVKPQTVKTSTERRFVF